MNRTCRGQKRVVRNHVCCCFAVISMKHSTQMFSAAWTLQITVQRIFTASCLSFQTRKCHPSWQTHYSLINNTSHRPFFSPHCWKNLFYFQIFFMPCFMENTGESRRQAKAFHLVGRHLQPLDNNGLETTPRPRRSCLCSGNGVGPEASFAAATP